VNEATTFRPILAMLALAMGRGDDRAQAEAVRLFFAAQARLRSRERSGRLGGVYPAVPYFGPGHPRADRPSDLATLPPGGAS